jgi:hypothetical protein
LPVAGQLDAEVHARPASHAFIVPPVPLELELEVELEVELELVTALPPSPELELVDELDAVGAPP